MENSASPRRSDLRPPDEDHVIVGRIRAPWGIRGDVSVEVLSDAPTRFAPGSVVYLKNQPSRIERAKDYKGGLLVKLDAINGRTEADALRGQLLTVPQEEIEPLPEGYYYHFQILDMAVQTDEGERLGIIKEIIETGSNDVYVVGLSGQNDILIPALKDVIRDVDLEQNLMTVRLPDGLR